VNEEMHIEVVGVRDGSEVRRKRREKWRTGSWFLLLQLSMQVTLCLVDVIITFVSFRVVFWLKNVNF
jgi:hypothetical protein